MDGRSSLYALHRCSPCNARTNTPALSFPPGNSHALQWLCSQKVLWVTGSRSTGRDPPPPVLPWKSHVLRGLPPKDLSITGTCDRCEPRGRAVENSTAGTLESDHHRLVGKKYRKKLLHSSLEMSQEHIKQPGPQVEERKRETCSSFVQKEGLKYRI